MAARRAGARLDAVCEVLERAAPLGLAQEWDNVGLLGGDLRDRITRVLLCIDMMPAVVDEAIRRRAELVLSYHPPLFRPVSRLVAPTSAMEAGLLRCLRHRVAVYSPHTALDAAAGGTNDVLAALCDVVSPRPIEPHPLDPALGMGRMGSLRKPTTLPALARRLARRAAAGCVAIVGRPDQQVRRALVAVGAAGSLPLTQELGPGDVIVTGELRHHDALHLLRVCAAAVVLSHWSSERPALASLAERLAGELPGVAFELSQADSEPFQRA